MKLEKGKNMEAKKRGRPFGTTKENKKKMYSFRLSGEELEAVRALLAKMRGKLVILFFLLPLSLPTYAAIEGGIEYNLDSIKQEAFQGVYKHCPFPDEISTRLTYFVQKFDESNILSINQDAQGFINVVYKDYPDFTYSYTVKKGHFYDPLSGYYCDHISINYGNKIATYHNHLYKLMAVRFIASSNEEYVFDMNGNLIGHKKGDKIEMAKIDIKKMHKAIYSEP